MFDLMVHHRDAKSGKITRETPYRCEIHKGVRYFARDGKWFTEAGEECGAPGESASTPAPSHFTRSAVAAQISAPNPKA